MKTLKDIGSLLKSARQKKGMTLEEVYKKTHIQQSTLKALEEGVVDKSIEGIYVKSFLKKYAFFLGLDKEFIAKEYDKNFPKTKNEPKASIMKPLSPKKEPSLEASKYIPLALGLIASVLILIFTVTTISRAVSFLKNAARKKVAIRLERREKAKGDFKTIQPKKEEAISSPINLSVKSLEKVWLHVEKDGKTAFEGILPKSAAESWTCEKSFKLRAGKLEALNFTVNSKYLGKIGEGVQNITIDSGGIRVGNKKIDLPKQL